MNSGQSRYVLHLGFTKKELPKELEEKKAKGLCFNCNEGTLGGTNAIRNNYMHLMLMMGNKRILFKKCHKMEEMKRFWNKKMTYKF